MTATRARPPTRVTATVPRQDAVRATARDAEHGRLQGIPNLCPQPQRWPRRAIRCRPSSWPRDPVKKVIDPGTAERVLSAVWALHNDVVDRQDTARMADFEVGAALELDVGRCQGAAPAPGQRSTATHNRSASTFRGTTSYPAQLMGSVLTTTSPTAAPSSCSLHSRRRRRQRTLEARPLRRLHHGLRVARSAGCRRRRVPTAAVASLERRPEHCVRATGPN